VSGQGKKELQQRGERKEVMARERKIELWQRGKRECTHRCVVTERRERERERERDSTKGSER